MRRSRASWPRRRSRSTRSPPQLGEPGLEVVSLALPPARTAGRIVGQGIEGVTELVRVLREEVKIL